MASLPAGSRLGPYLVAEPIGQGVWARSIAPATPNCTARRPDSIDALAAASGRAKSNLSRTLRTMERYGLVRLEKGEGRKLRPVVTFQTVELRMTVAA